MTSVISIILLLIFLFLSSIHFYWGFGGRRGKESVIPTTRNNTKVFSPTPTSTFSVAIGLLAICTFILIKAGFLNILIPAVLVKYGLWIIAVIFLLRAVGEFKYVGFLKKIKHTEFAENDTKYYSPLCLVIGVLSIILELNK